MTTLDCPFCRKVADWQALPTDELVWTFPHSLVLLGPWQFFQGYCLLVSRRHATELSQLTTEERRAFLDEMCLVAQAIEEAFHPHKLNYELLGNQVPHLHWHLFPRYREDPDRLRPVWLALERAETDDDQRRRLLADPLSRAVTAELLRRHVQKLVARQSNSNAGGPR